MIMSRSPRAPKEWGPALQMLSMKMVLCIHYMLEEGHSFAIA